MKTLKQFFLVLTLIATILALWQVPLVTAQEDSAQNETTQEQTGQDEGEEQPKSIFELPDPSRYEGVAVTSAGSAQQQFNELVNGLVQALRFIIGAVAVLMAVYSGFRMITGWGKEDVYQKARASLLYAVIGLAAVGLAGEISTIFSLEKGGFLRDPNQVLRTAVLFDQRTQIIITFIKYFVGGVAILYIIRSGLRLITAGESEEKVAIDKKNLTYGAIGLVLIIIADTAISEVFFKIDLTRYPGVGGAEPEIDPARGVQEIVGFTNFIVSIVGPIAVLALLAGGVMYIIAAGEEEKMARAKRLILLALVGIVLIYGAFAIVSTFVLGQFGAAPPAA